MSLRFAETWRKKEASIGSVYIRVPRELYRRYDRRTRRDVGLVKSSRRYIIVISNRAPALLLDVYWTELSRSYIKGDRRDGGVGREAAGAWFEIRKSLNTFSAGAKLVLG